MNPTTLAQELTDAYARRAIVTAPSSRDGGIVACRLNHRVPDVWAGPPEGVLPRLGRGPCQDERCGQAAAGLRIQHLLLAEIRPLEQFGRQDDFCAARRRLADKG